MCTDCREIQVWCEARHWMPSQNSKNSEFLLRILTSCTLNLLICVFVTLLAWKWHYQGCIFNEGVQFNILNLYTFELYEFNVISILISPINFILATWGRLIEWEMWMWRKQIGGNLVMWERLFNLGLEGWLSEWRKVDNSRIFRRDHL